MNTHSAVKIVQRSLYEAIPPRKLEKAKLLIYRAVQKGYGLSRSTSILDASTVKPTKRSYVLSVHATDFQKIVDGKKRYILTKVKYHVGDTLNMYEYVRSAYTDRTCTVTITDVLQSSTTNGLQEGWYVVSW